MELSRFLNIARRYLWLVVLATLIPSLTTYILLSKEPVSYQAKTRLLIGPSLDSPSPDLNSLKIGGTLIQTYAGLMDTKDFLTSINDRLSHKVDDLNTLDTMLVVRTNTDTRVLTITVYNPSPTDAVEIANAAATALVEMSPAKDNTTIVLLRKQMSDQSQELGQIIANSNTSIQKLEADLVAMGNAAVERSPIAAKAISDKQRLVTTQLADERGRLSDAVRTLATIYQVLLDTNTNQVAIIDLAVKASRVNKNKVLNMVSTGGSGLIIAVIIIFALEYFDDRIRSSGDFTRIARVPLLSTIEKNTPLNGSGIARVVTFAQPISLAANAYHTAVAKLLFSIGKSMPHTLMVSSVGSRSGEDSADIAVNLAVVFAQAGNRVVLVDAQLHNPALTELFGATDSTGLVDLLATNPPKLELIQVKEVPGLHLLPAGLLTSKMSPGIVLNSIKITKQIKELKKDADIVLVVSSPISWFAESLALASSVNSVILVARHGESHGKIVNDVIENLRVMNIQLAGVIFDQNSSPNTSKQNLKNVAVNVSADVLVASENSQLIKS